MTEFTSQQNMKLVAEAVAETEDGAVSKAWAELLADARQVAAMRDAAVQGIAVGHARLQEAQREIKTLKDNIAHRQRAAIDAIAYQFHCDISATRDRFMRSPELARLLKEGDHDGEGKGTTTDEAPSDATEGAAT